MADRWVERRRDQSAASALPTSELKSSMREFIDEVAYALAEEESSQLPAGRARQHASSDSPPDTNLADLLRRALVRAGIVDHYLHRCRKHGCKHQEQAPDADARRCPKHRVKLWAKPVARCIRWHDTRHSAATLLLQAGASIPVVQRVLRHHDPKLTTNLYGHLEVDWLGGEIERLNLNRPSSSTARQTEANTDKETDASPHTSVVEEDPWLRSSSG